LFYLAAHYTGAVNLAILQGSIPAVVFLGAFLAFGTRIRPGQIFGVVLTLVGVALVAGKGDLQTILTLESFALTESDGAADIARVAERTIDPWLREHYLRHATDERRHGELFAEWAHDLRQHHPQGTRVSARSPSPAERARAISIATMIALAIEHAGPQACGEFRILVRRVIARIDARNAALGEQSFDAGDTEREEPLDVCS
ncbi:MAG TPA: DMT family transporter, partial [Rhizobiaceae bacterium]|nr:DMT family transporter [Rhizobiaceae bacterium]